MKDDLHPIEKIMTQAMEKIKGVIDVNTVVGSPLTMKDGTMIIPITKVSAGFVAGGGEYSQDLKPQNNKKEYPFAGGSGTGFSVNPIGFLVGSNGNMKLITLENKNTFDAIMQIAKNLSEKLKKE